MMTHDREDEMAARAVVWRAHIEAWRRGDVSQRAYCEAHGLSRRNFTNWRQRFKEEELRLEQGAPARQIPHFTDARVRRRVAFPADRRLPQRAPLRQRLSGKL